MSTEKIIAPNDELVKVIPFRPKGEAKQAEPQDDQALNKFSIIDVIRSVLSESSTLNKNEKLVVLTLARHADAKGECFPGQPRIARICGLSERTVRNTLKGLDGVWFDRKSLVGDKTVYKLTPARAAALATTSAPETTAAHPGKTCRSPRQPLPPKYSIEVDQEVAQILSPSKDADMANGILLSVASEGKPTRKSTTAAKKITSSQKQDDKVAKDRELQNKAVSFMLHLDAELRRVVNHGISEDDKRKVISNAKKALLGGTLEEYKAAISWAIDQPPAYPSQKTWAMKLSGTPYGSYRDILGAWRNRDKAPARYGNSHQAQPSGPPGLSPELRKHLESKSAQNSTEVAH